MIKVTASASTKEELIQFIDDSIRMANNNHMKIYNLKKPKNPNGKYHKGYLEVGYLYEKKIDI